MVLRQSAHCLMSSPVPIVATESRKFAREFDAYVKALNAIG